MKKNKPYWLLTSEYPPDYGGGIATYARETALMLSQAGYSVSIFIQDFSVKSFSITESESARIIRFSPASFLEEDILGYEAKLSFGFAKAVQHFMEEEGVPDWLEAQEYLGIAYYTLQFKHLHFPLFKDLKVLLTLHAPSFLYLEFNKVNYFRFPYFWVGEMERSCIQSADVLISPSAYLVNVLKGRMDEPKTPIHVIPNPYQVEKSFLPSPTNRKKIVFFGKLTPQKGIPAIFPFWEDVLKQHPDICLHLIGGGTHLYHPEEQSMDDYLQAKYRSLFASGRIVSHGNVAPARLHDILHDAHIVLIPSTVDNLPYTVLEGMSNGKVMLASKQGGQSEIINNGINGFLFDYNEPQSFALQLNHILNLSQEAYTAVQQAAREKIVTTYNHSSISEQKLRVLNSYTAADQKGFPFTRYSFLPKGQQILASTPEGFSLIIPFYNMEAFIEECLTSVVASSYPPDEIIIINDGSTHPDSKKVLEEMSKKFSCQVVHRSNEGLAMARNAGAEIAKGSIIAFLDPDDKVKPSYYEKAIQILTHKENVSFVGCWAEYFGNSAGTWPTFNPEPPYLLYHNMVNSSALVIKRQAYLSAGKNDPAMIYGMEDYESVIRLIKHGYGGVVIPEALWEYRVRANSMARNFNQEKQNYLYRLIAHKHSDIYATFAPDLICLLNTNGPGYLIDNPSIYHFYGDDKNFGGKLKRYVYNKIKEHPGMRKWALKAKKFLK